MKKLFTLTGVFVGIYLAFLFVLYSSSLIFPNTQGVLYDCMLDRSINADELSSISKENNITAFTTEYNNTSFFEKDVVFNFFNNSDKDNIRYGLQKKIIGTNKISYKENSNNELKIHRFWAIETNEANFGLFSNELEEYGLQKEVFESHRMNLSVIFAKRNVEFFLCVVIFLVFCVSIYYILRSKEIAILKLCGYNEIFISLKILIKAMKCIVAGYTVIGCIFSLYLLLYDRFLMFDFLKLYTYIFFCLCVVMVFICMLGAIFVKISKIIPALKNNKNNKLLILIVVIFKIVITVVFVYSATHLYNDYLDYKLTNIGYISIESKDFSYIKTSKTPDEKMMNDILINIEKIGLEEIYNYSNPTYGLYGHEVFNDNEKRENMLTDPPIISMSHNMLKLIKIYSEKGDIFDTGSLNDKETILLLPTNLKNDTSEILNKFDNSSNIKVEYIKEKQEHFNFLSPSEKVYNAVYLLKPTERSIYFNNGRVLFAKNSIKDMEEGLASIGADRGTVTLINLEAEYKKTLDNMQLKFIDNLQFSFINMLSFLLAIIAIGVVYCEFRKKEIAIMKVSSQRPMRVIYMLSGINVAITVSVSLFINPMLIVLCVLEVLIYMLIVYLYYSKKALGILKGE